MFCLWLCLWLGLHVVMRVLLVGSFNIRFYGQIRLKLNKITVRLTKSQGSALGGVCGFSYISRYLTRLSVLVIAYDSLLVFPKACIEQGIALHQGIYADSYRFLGVVCLALSTLLLHLDHYSSVVYLISGYCNRYLLHYCIFPAFLCRSTSFLPFFPLQ